VSEQDCSGTVTSFHWDARNRLDSLNLDGTAYAFRYDPRGRLARVDKNGTHYRYFWWNGDDLLAELDTTGAVVGEYSYRGIDDLHAYKKGSTGTKYYAHKDMLGNVIALTNGGSLARTYEYDAWGQPTGGGEWVTFSGKDRARWKGALYFDEFDLYYMRARWYQPETGRFLSEDPIGLVGGINPFVFAAGDPINFSDPFGMRPCRDGEWGVHWDYDAELSENDDVLVVTSKKKERHWCFGPSGEMDGQEPIALTFPAFGTGGLIKGIVVRAGGRIVRAIRNLRSLWAARGIAQPSARQIAAFERQLVEHGRESVLRSHRKINRRLQEHLEYLDELRATGGYTSSVEREIRNWHRELEAIRRVLGGG
jgi:RHS repeat-associated protein